MSSSIDRYVLDIGTKKLLLLVLALQFALFGVAALDHIDLKIFILRQIICFIYLAFIPGILILKILRIGESDLTEAIVLSIGLSVSFLIFTGILFNFLGPLIGITKPISEIPLIIFISAIVLLFCVLLHLRQKNFHHRLFNLKKSSINPFLFTILFPLIAILGVHLLNVNGNNLLLLSLLAAIAITPILVVLDKIPKDFYSTAVWTISISLLFYNSLVFNRFLGYPGILIGIDNFWDPNIASPHNSLIAQSMPFAIFSVVGDINFMVVRKVIYPLLFSVVPVILYQMYKRQFSEKISFLACFLFMSTYFFITIFSENIRTGMALFFIVLFIFLIINENIKPVKKTLLSIIFLFCLAMSHYGLSYVFLFVLAFVVFSLSLSKRIGNLKTSFTTYGLTIFYFVFTISWYIYTSGGALFEWYTDYTTNVVTNLLELFISTETSYTLHAVQETWPSFSIMVTKYLFIVVTVSIVIGLIDLLYKHLFKKDSALSAEFVIYSLGFSGILVGMILPTGSYATPRPYQMALSLLAPLGITGGMKLVNTMNKRLKRKIRNANCDRNKYTSLALAVFLSIFLLFNSGFASGVITKDYSPAVLISKNRIMKSEVTEANIHEKMYFYSKYSPTPDVYSSEWFLAKGKIDNTIYRDFIGGARLSSFWPNTTKRIIEKKIELNQRIMRSNTSLGENSYVYLGYHNHIDDIVLLDRFTNWYKLDQITHKLEKRNKIYTNGGSIIYG